MPDRPQPKPVPADPRELVREYLRERIVGANLSGWHRHYAYLKVLTLVEGIARGREPTRYAWLEYAPHHIWTRGRWRGVAPRIRALDVAAGSALWLPAWLFYSWAGIDGRTVREHTMWTLFTEAEIEDAARRDNAANAQPEPPETEPPKTPPEPPIDWIH